ncbi:MAG: protein translocase subunit SecD [Candidatus Nomurabacteria bacterium]|nr:MAG: protein translocase subunit SecD [Candidatus Nomurabacteria bacterium]
MTVRKKVWLSFAGILLLTLLAGTIDYQKPIRIHVGPVDWTIDLPVQLGLDLQGGVSLLYDADLSQVAPAEAQDAVEGVRDVIERRVNAFGVSEPVVQTQKAGDQWRVSIELPGVTDVNQAIAQIGQTPTLEFREQIETTPEDPAAIEAQNEEVRKKAQDVLAQALQPDADFAQLAQLYSEDPGSKDNGGDLGFAQQGTFVQEFDDVLFGDLAVGQVYPELVESQFGLHIIKKTDERTANQDGQDVREVQGSHILFILQSTEPSTDFVATGLSGKDLERASVVFDQTTNTPEISLNFNSEGTQLFKEITERNVGKVVAIYLDGFPLSLPTVQQAITSGEAVISGDFTLQEARDLARNLNAGALPVPITLVSQQNVGPTLGERSVQSSFVAGIIGLGLVALFMILYYRLPGLISVLALGVYSAVVFAIFILWPVTLTLAGIAGFILSIGMAVDANVLIFERMKEELREGRPLNQAIEEGFRRAWLSIRDSNISSLITTFILAWFGTSIIKGFAITLAIGILVSMFSAIVVTRTFLRLTQRWVSVAWLYGVRKKEQV